MSFLSGTAEDFGQDWHEKWNSRVLLCVENLPQLAVPSFLLYLQGAQGVTGWDWAQTLVFSLLNIVIRLRKLGKDLRGREIEMVEHGAGVAGAVGPVLGPTAGQLNLFWVLFWLLCDVTRCVNLVTSQTKSYDRFVTCVQRLCTRRRQKPNLCQSC